MSRIRQLCALALAMAVTPPATPLSAATLDSSAGPLALTRMAEGLQVPWAFGFLPDGAVLITERRGRLWQLQSSSAIDASAKASERQLR